MSQAQDHAKEQLYLANIIEAHTKAFEQTLFLAGANFGVHPGALLLSIEKFKGQMRAAVDYAVLQADTPHTPDDLARDRAFHN